MKKWITDEASNQRYLEQLKLIWDSSKQLALQSNADENKAWEKFQNRIHPRESNIPAKTRRFAWWKFAAAAILLISIGLITYVLVSKQIAAGEMEILAHEVPVTDTLPDGSVITLNKRSFIFYTERSGTNSRVVTLKGEAFFNVAPDKKKPFTVRANDVLVTVVGTSFYVKAANGITEVVVESGIVQVNKAGKIIELKPGERTTITGEDSIPVKEEVTDKLYNYYRTKEFVCEDTPLWKLVEVLNEAYSANIIIGKKELRDIPLDATFVNEPLGQVLHVVSLTLNITVTRSGDQIILQ